MKRLFLFFFMVSLSVSLSSSEERDPWQIPEEDLQVVNFFDLEGEILDKILEEKAEEIAIELPGNSYIPAKYLFTGDFFKFTKPSGDLGYMEIKKTFYMRCIKGQYIFSEDLKNWKPFSAFTSGYISLDIKLDHGNPSIVLVEEASRKSFSEEPGK